MSCHLQDLLSEPGTVWVPPPPGAEAGVDRVELDALLRATPPSARSWALRCAFEEGGPWAGVRDLFRELLDDLRGAAPDLVHRHDYELVHVLPELRCQLQLRNPCLTDTAEGDERIRNYPADRAYRIVHGLIDLLAAYKARHDDRVWLLACIDFDRASDMAARFFRELMRRAGARSRFVLLALGTAAAEGDLPAPAAPPHRRLACSILLPPRGDLPSAAAALQRVAELEAVVSSDILEQTALIPDLIYHSRLAERPEKLLRWLAAALLSYNTLGFYAESARYGEEAWTLFQRARFDSDPTEMRWSMFFKLFMTYLGVGDVERAMRLAHEDALADHGDPRDLPMRASLCYMIAMLYGRHLPDRDFSQAEEYLRRGLDYLDRADIPDDKRWFQFVFNRNGLAMVRSFQGRHAEALRLCEEGFQLLEEHLASGRHRLHRSVLLYNMAQVFTQIRDYERSIVYYTAAMEMDPNYSEYYNERGSIHLKLGRLAEAEADYLRAIELSPPYYEVWTNLGQCHRLGGRHHEACADYARALDLLPGQAAPHIGRAQALEALGDLDAAVADYSAALAADPTLWKAHAGRAVLLYERGRLPECLTDLDRAVDLAPAEADLFLNRSVALADLGRTAEARRDLERYLELRPDAADRGEVEARLAGTQPLMEATS